ncbi:peroxiredoxin-like family protein [Paraglaciecola aquimarina]|uniref:thioredoxin-dependent peroxiredoxin n=1 Tax=Paraglaciecola aquimarina TaxID=1235557 RepID=A0ABU3SSE9_9ALTE|nr:peroxiredoxin-like family protein [Paraglaciecola aquimarina]MDU0352915.1 peroxiredoxin-like family protein [Paraglaciecola aquimarina]
MQKLSLFIVVTAFISFSSLALDRTKIADSVQDVTPLLNGQVAPKATLQSVEGNAVSLKALTMDKPTIVIFYRGGWCPYCSRQLAGLKDIEGKLDDLGYQILAVSPETPAQLQEQKLQTKFTVKLYSDAELQAISGFGIGYYVADQQRDAYKAKKNIVLNNDKATGTAVLPAPAVFILDQKGIVKFNYVNPDTRTRISPELLYQAAKLSL